MSPDNQNWALRVRERRGEASVSFLFATPIASGVGRSEAHWHRWTTDGGFAPGPAWHHVAVSYRFGEPASVRGWVDGQPLAGSWDMGGATTEPPVVDDDAVWIGSSLGGNPANSFRGSLDAIALHRRILDDAELASRYRRTGVDPAVASGPEAMPELGPMPPGRVRVTAHEGMPSHDRWPSPGESTPPETTAWETEAFLVARLPSRYDDWGIRETWQGAVLVRAAADVELGPGTHRFLMRSGGQARLWVDGAIVARSRPMPGAPDGEEPITPVASPPRPGLRAARHRQQEVAGEVALGDGGRARVVLEAIVGGAVVPGRHGGAVRGGRDAGRPIVRPAGSRRFGRRADRADRPRGRGRPRPPGGGALRLRRPGPPGGRVERGRILVEPPPDCSRLGSFPSRADGARRQFASGRCLPRREDRPRPRRGGAHPAGRGRAVPRDGAADPPGRLLPLPRREGEGRPAARLARGGPQRGRLRVARPGPGRPRRERADLPDSLRRSARPDAPRRGRPGARRRSRPWRSGSAPAPDGRRRRWTRPRSSRRPRSTTPRSSAASPSTPSACPPRRTRCWPSSPTTAPTSTTGRSTACSATTAGPTTGWDTGRTCWPRTRPC